MLPYSFAVFVLNVGCLNARHNNQYKLQVGYTFNQTNKRYETNAVTFEYANDYNSAKIDQLVAVCWRPARSNVSLAAAQWAAKLHLVQTCCWRFRAGCCGNCSHLTALRDGKLWPTNRGSGMHD